MTAHTYVLWLIDVWRAKTEAVFVLAVFKISLIDGQVVCRGTKAKCEPFVVARVEDFMKIIETKKALDASESYSQAIVVNGCVFTSGQIPTESSSIARRFWKWLGQGNQDNLFPCEYG